jgi:hypothetical protein
MITIRLPDDKHTRLRQLAESRAMSMNKLFEELAMMALTQFDVETRFRARAARRDVTVGLRLLKELDEADARETERH